GSGGAAPARSGRSSRGWRGWCWAPGVGAAATAAIASRRSRDEGRPMQQRSFLLLLTATVIVVAIAMSVLTTGDRTASPAPAGERALPGLAAKLVDLAWVGLSRGSTKIDFAAINGRWAVVEKGNYPAAQG